MINIERARAIVEFDLDSTKYKEGAREVQRESARASAAVDQMGQATEATQSRLERMVNATKSGWKGIGDGLDSIGKAMTPLNQGLELGSKAAQFLGNAMEGAAKRHPEYAKSYKSITDEVTRYKNAVTDAIGITAIEVLKPLPSIKELERAYEGATTAVMRHFKAYMSPEAQRARAMAFVFQGGFIDAGKAAVADMLPKADPWAGGKSASEMWDEFAAKMKAEQERLQAGSAGSTRSTRTDTAGPTIGWSDRAQNNFTDPAALEKWLGPKLEGREDRRALPDKMMSQWGVDMAAQIDAIGKATASIEGPTLLERLGLQDPEPWALAVAGVQAFGQAWQSSLKSIGEGNMAAAEIFKKGLAMVVSGIGDQLAALSVTELVKGAAMLITLNPKGALHLAAGGVYAGGAVAAYAAAKKLGGTGGSVSTTAPPTGAPSATGGRGASTTGGASSSGERSESSRPVVVVVGSHFDEMSARERRQRSNEAIERALRERDE